MTQHSAPQGSLSLVVSCISYHAGSRDLKHESDNKQSAIRNRLAIQLWVYSFPSGHWVSSSNTTSSRTPPKWNLGEFNV